MGLFKRLLGEAGPSHDDLQRQADEEIKQMMASAGRPTDMPATPLAPDGEPQPQKAPAK